MGQKRLAVGKEEPERSPNDEEEEAQMITELAEWCLNWADTWSDDFDGIDKRIEVHPMQFTEEPVPSYAMLGAALQIFSVNVMELNGILCWPIDVFGFIAVHDSVDRNHNYIFERSRDDCRTFTAKDLFLVLTDPSSAVQLVDPVIFEIELRAKGTRPSEDKILSAGVLEYNCIIAYKADSFPEYMVSGLRSTLEFKYAHLGLALEATIKIWIAEGSTDFSMKFVAHTSSIDESVTLLDYGDGKVTVSDDGFIDLSRNVVVVEHNGELIVAIQARRSGEEETSSVCKAFIWSDSCHI